MRVMRLLAVTVGLTVLAQGQAVAAPPAQVTWESSCDGSVRTFQTRVSSPKRVDVCGDRRRDIVVTYTPVTGGARVEVDKLGSNPLALRIVAASTLGYDARDSGAPATFDGTFTMASSIRDTDLEVIGASPSLTVLAGEATTLALQGIPAEFSVGLEVRPAAMSYRASGPLDSFTFDSTDSGFFARGTHMRVALMNVSREVNADFAALEFDAGDGVVGGFDATLSDGSTAEFPAGSDGIVLRDTPARYLVAARLTGLRSVSVGVPVFVVQSHLDGHRPLHLDLRRGEMITTAQTSATPSTLSMGLTQDSDGAIRWQQVSSEAIELIQIEAVNPAVGGRATRVNLRLVDVPTSVDVRLGTAALNVDSSSSSLNLEALVSNGPAETLPSGVDGVVFRETLSTYLVAARLTNVRSARVTAASFDLVGGSGDFAVITDVLQLRIDGGPSTMALDLDADGLDYAGSAPANSLAISGERQITAAPLPASLRVCSDPDGQACVGGGLPANRGSVSVSASERTMLNYDDLFTDLSVQRLVLGVDLHVVEQSGTIFLDTDNLLIAGSLDGESVDGHFPSGTRADNRLATFQWPMVQRQGTITCPSGFDLDATVELGVKVDLTGYLC